MYCQQAANNSRGVFHELTPKRPPGSLESVWSTSRGIRFTALSRRTFQPRCDASAAPLPPGGPFCTLLRALIITPPICEEIPVIRWRKSDKRSSWKVLIS